MIFRSPTSKNFRLHIVLVPRYRVVPQLLSCSLYLFLYCPWKIIFLMTILAVFLLMWFISNQSDHYVIPILTEWFLCDFYSCRAMPWWLPLLQSCFVLKKFTYGPQIDWGGNKTLLSVISCQFSSGEVKQLAIAEFSSYHKKSLAGRYVSSHLTLGDKEFSDFGVIKKLSLATSTLISAS